MPARALGRRGESQAVLEPFASRAGVGCRRRRTPSGIPPTSPAGSAVRLAWRLRALGITHAIWDLSLRRRRQGAGLLRRRNECERGLAWNVRYSLWSGGWSAPMLVVGLPGQQVELQRERERQSSDAHHLAQLRHRAERHGARRTWPRRSRSYTRTSPSRSSASRRTTTSRCCRPPRSPRPARTSPSCGPVSSPCSTRASW